jgi:hypothetical protein
MWEFIIESANEEIKKYVTSLKEDVSILDDTKNKKMNPNIRNCIRYRINEKKVYHYLKCCAQKVKEFAKLSYEKALDKLAKMKDQQDEIVSKNVDYFEKVFIPLLKPTYT